MIAHVLQFGLISLISSLIYYSLREDDLRTAVHHGLRRFFSFFLLAIVFGGALLLFTRWL